MFQRVAQAANLFQTGRRQTDIGRHFRRNFGVGLAELGVKGIGQRQVPDVAAFRRSGDVLAGMPHVGAADHAGNIEDGGSFLIVVGGKKERHDGVFFVVEHVGVQSVDQYVGFTGNVSVHMDGAAVNGVVFPVDHHVNGEERLLRTGTRIYGRGTADEVLRVNASV